MTIPQTPAPAGSAPGGDNGPAPTGGVNPSGPAAPSSGGITLTDVARIVAEAQAPLLAKIEALANPVGARRRVAGKSQQDQDPPAGQAGNGGDSEDFEALKREFEALKALERQRQEREAADKVGSALKSTIAAGKYVNADILESLIAPKLKIGVAGEVIYDDGKAVRQLSDVVREFGARGIFQAPSNGDGSGAHNRGEPVAGIQHGERVVKAEDIESMDDQAFDNLFADVQRSKPVI